jgi:hypothetical protein
MSTQNMYAVGARLLGIYFVVSGLTLLPGVYTARSLVDAAGLPISPHYVLTAAIQALLFILAGCILVVRFRRLQVAEVSPVPIASGFKLLGAFFVVTGSSNMIGGIARGLLAPSFSPERFVHALPGVIALVGGAILWANSERFARIPANAA